jgi:hypothetical protein
VWAEGLVNSRLGCMSVGPRSIAGRGACVTGCRPGPPPQWSTSSLWHSLRSPALKAPRSRSCHGPVTVVSRCSRPITLCSVLLMPTVSRLSRFFPSCAAQRLRYSGNLNNSEKTVTSGHRRKIKGLYRDMIVTRCDRTKTWLATDPQAALARVSAMFPTVLTLGASSRLPTPKKM